MSTHKPSLYDEIEQCNYQLDCFFRERFGVSLKVYKSIKAVTQFAGVLACVYSMYLGTEPFVPVVIIGAIILGPEWVEANLLEQRGN